VFSIGLLEHFNANGSALTGPLLKRHEQSVVWLFFGSAGTDTDGLFR
jgi:hypothetical protein